MVSGRGGDGLSVGGGECVAAGKGGVMFVCSGTGLCSGTADSVAVDGCVGCVAAVGDAAAGAAFVGEATAFGDVLTVGVTCRFCMSAVTVLADGALVLSVGAAAPERMDEGDVG